jgi:hypothetical protein
MRPPPSISSAFDMFVEPFGPLTFGTRLTSSMNVAGQAAGQVAGRAWRHTSAVDLVENVGLPVMVATTGTGR